jgi:hypothetical protein
MSIGDELEKAGIIDPYGFLRLERPDEFHINSGNCHSVRYIHDLEKLLSQETQRRERFEEEVECTHKWLDQHGAAPRVSEGGEVYSLIGRVTWLVNA